jgi:hypothetical protein
VPDPGDVVGGPTGFPDWAKPYFDRFGTAPNWLIAATRWMFPNNKLTPMQQGLAAVTTDAAIHLELFGRGFLRSLKDLGDAWAEDLNDRTGNPDADAIGGWVRIGMAIYHIPGAIGRAFEAAYEDPDGALGYGTGLILETWLMKKAGEAMLKEPCPTGARATAAPLKVPQGLTEAQFNEAASVIRAKTGHIEGEVVVQGSRAAGTAKATSDIDFAIRVSQEQFDALIKASFGTPNLGSAKFRTMQHAIETGKIQAGEAGLRGVRVDLEGKLGMEVDISVIRKGGPFDNPPFIPLPK